VSLAGLFAAVVIVGISCVNAAIPAAAWARSHDGRFLLLSSSSAALAVLGLLWAWGQLPLSPPSWTWVSLPIELVALLVTVLLLAASLSPRRA
jgi:hypothetical protein